MEHIFKRTLSIVLTIAMLVTMIPYAATHVHAAGLLTTSVTGLEASWTDASNSSGKASWSASGTTITGNATGYTSWFTGRQITTKLTLTNNFDCEATLSFNYLLTGGGSVSDAISGTSGPYEGKLAAGGSITITLTSPSGNSTNTLSITGITLISANAEDVTTTFQSAEGGSYTVNGTAITTDTEMTSTAGTNYELVATPASGYQFFGWYNGTTYLSYATSYTHKAAETGSITPVFIASTTALFGVGAAKFFNLGEAGTYAANNTDKTIVLLNNGTVTGNHTIPAGVTLLIPYNSANTAYGANASCTDTPGLIFDTNVAWVKPTAYRTLTLADDANITVNGSIEVGGRHAASNGGGLYCGAPSGPLGFIDMKTGSVITLNSNANLYCWGYIIGGGEIVAKSGSNVYENFQFTDFRGGSATGDLAQNYKSYGVFPLNQYYVQNIEAYLTLESGAVEYSATSIFAVSSTNSATLAFIGNNDDAMFKLTSGSVTKHYDGSTDRLNIEINGNLSVSPITMSIAIYTIDSVNFELPITNNMTVQAHSGSTISISQDIAMLPGAEIIVDSGAVCTLSAGVSAYLYDSEQWGLYSGAKNKLMVPLDYVPGRVSGVNRMSGITAASQMADAKITVNGTMDASVGYVYTTAGGAQVVSTGTGEILMNPDQPETSVTYQNVYIKDNTEGGMVEIPVNSAWLRHGDGSYLKTADGIPGSTYKYCIADNHNKWYISPCGCCAGNHTPSENEVDCTTAQTCTVCGEILVAALGHTAGEAATCTTAQTCTVCGDEIVAALGHTEGEAVTENEVAATCTADGSYDNVVYCSACDVELSRETITVAATGHTEVVDAAVAATCTETGLTEGKHCSVCNEVLVAQEVVSATGHTEVVDAAQAPTCTETGLKEGKHCSVCGEVFVAQEVIPAAGHTEGEAVTENNVAETCTTAGSYDTVIYCTVCNVELSRKNTTVAATGHTEGEAEIESEVTPSCTETGSYDTVIYCTVCGDEVSRETTTVAATGHTEGEAVTENEVAVTCTTNGSYDTVVYCTVCSAAISRVTTTIEATGHTEVDDAAVAATCTETGLTAGKHCSVCGTVTVAQEVVPANGHTNGEAVTENEVAPSCTDTGSYDTVIYCTVCGDEVSRETTTVAAAGHTEVDDAAVAATCTETGLTAGKHCSVCGSVTVAQTVVPATGHTEGAVVVENEVPATCTADGSYDNVVYCSVCNAELSRSTVTVSATGHTEGTAGVENNVDATCTDDGSYDTVVYCSVCGEELSRQTTVVPATGHTEGEAVTEKEVAATCTTDGSYDTVVYCSVCNAELSRKSTTVPATGHTGGEVVVENNVAPTCTVTGSYDNVKYCTVCGEEASRETVVVAAKGHTYNNVVTAPTCETSGYTTYTCGTCGDTYKADEISALGHTEGKTNVENNVAATCTEDGSYENVVYCSVCKEELSREKVTVSASGHKYSSEVTAPTCTEDGYTTYTCSACGNTYTSDVVTTPGHQYSSVVTAPTCAAGGYTTHTCATCGDTYTDTELPAREHQYNPVVTAPTCEADGYTTYTCMYDDCKHSYTGDTVSATGHAYSAVVTAPTCTEDGYTTYTCSNCKDTYTADEVSASGHKYSSVVTIPTCTEGGYTTYTCSVCGDNNVADETPAEGHDIISHDAQAATCTEIGWDAYETCSKCNYTTYKEIAALGHTDVDPKDYICDVCGTDLCTDHEVEILEAKAATCTETGLTEGEKCSICGDVITAQTIIPATGHQNTIIVGAKVATYDEEGYTGDTYCNDCDTTIEKGETLPPKTGAEASVNGFKYGTLAEAVAAAKDGETVVLEKDVVLTEMLYVNTAQTWEFGEFSLTTGQVDAYSYAIVINSDLKIESGTYRINSMYGIAVSNTGSLTVEDGTFENVSANDYLIGNFGTTTIKGGTFKGQYCCVNNFTDDEYNGVANIYGGTFSTEATDETGGYEPCDLMANEGLTVYGGTYSKDVTKYCDDGYHTVDSDNNGTYTYGVHTHSLVVTSPTCVDEGYSTYTCVCGDTYVSDIVAAQGHSITTYVARAATCTEIGWNAYEKCSKCTYTTYTEIPASGHTIEEVEAQAATCTEIGWNAYEKCSKCTYTTYTEIAASGHSYEEAVTAPTCISGGFTLHTCTVCGDNYKDNVTNPLGHSYSAVVTAPTCTDGGYTTYTCSVCTNSYTANETAALGHTSGAVVVENKKSETCTADGSYDNVVYCTVCGCELSRSTVVVPAKGHTPGNVVEENKVSATCTADGGYDNVVYCTVCNTEVSRETVTIPAKGHTSGKTVVENKVAATCTTDGSYDNAAYCTVCNTEVSRETIVVPATGHTSGAVVVENEVAATCTEDGSYDNAVYCTVCTAEVGRVTKVVPATGHTSGAVVVENEVAVTCTEDGSYDNAVYCTICNTEVSRETVVVPATGHTAGAEATCTTAQTCTVCGDELSAALGHTAGESVVENNVDATCTTDGSYDTVVYCSVCDAELSRVNTIVPATGHTAGAEATCTTAQTCTVCGDELSAALGHTAGESVVENNVDATCTTDGSYDTVVYCSVCDTELSRVNTIIPASGHTDTEAVIENSVDADCTNAGSYDSVVYCSVCTVEISRTTEVISALGHTAGEVVVENSVAATCTVDGSYDNVVYCSVCDAELSRENAVVPATGHTADDTVLENNVDATCTGDGHYDNAVYCTVCDAEVSRETVVVPATGHTAGDTVQENYVDATCTTDGVCHAVVYCTECDIELSRKYYKAIPATGHTAGEQVIENEIAAGCLTEGYYDIVTYCTVCDAEVSRATVPITPTGHKTEYSENVVMPTCTKDGSYSSMTVCTLCNGVLSREVETIPATGHTAGTAVKENEVAATCIKDGSYDTVTYCTVCGEEVSRETTVIPATGHTAGTAVKENEVAATCTADGSYDTVTYCTVCGEEASRETTVIPATGHTAGTAVKENEVAATCTKDGSYDTVTYCTVCDEEVSRETTVIPAAGHAEGEEITENEKNATCTIDGSYDSVVYCTVCKQEVSRVTTTVPATGHTHTGYGVNTEQHWSICSCGEAFAKDNHKFVDNACVCGNINVILFGEGVAYTVEGRVVTVTHHSACKVGYLVDGQYVAVESVENADGSYSFTVPDDATEVILVVNGDLDADGDTDQDDAAILAKALLPSDYDAYDPLDDARQAFAADINSNGKLNSADKTLLARALLNSEHTMYKPVEW